MRKLLTVPFLWMLLTLFVSADDHNGKVLFEKKCMSCHLLNKPEDRSKMKAPPLGIMVPRMREFIDGADRKTHV